MKYLCRIGLHRFKFRRPRYFGNGALEVCDRCGKGRIINFAAGCYEYFDAQAIEARSGETGTGSIRQDESAVRQDAPNTDGELARTKSEAGE